MQRMIVVLAVLALAVPAGVAAGGWATVGLANLPEDVNAGDAWDAQITVLRHGQTPTDGAKPLVTIRGDDGGARSFAARPTGKTGRYVARVVFPSAGIWRFSINNGLSATGYGADATTTYSPVEISAPGGSGDGFPRLPVTLAVLAAVAAAVLALTLRRRAQHPVPAA